MKNKKVRKVLLSPRDKLILRDLFSSKGLNLEILHSRHFKDRHKSTAVKRLNRLYDGNYLAKGALSGRSENQIIYTISPNGLDQIRDLLPSEMIRVELKSSNLEHDLELSRIFDRLKLARGLVEIKTENEIQSFVFGNNDLDYEPFRRLNTDIYLSLLIKEKNYKVAVEYERSYKESDRWNKLLLQYHLEESIDFILYLSKDHYIESALKRVEATFANKFSSKIFFCTLNDFNFNNEMASFKRLDGKSFTMNFQY